jgi:hypothetical protein
MADPKEIDRLAASGIIEHDTLSSMLTLLREIGAVD